MANILNIFITGNFFIVFYENNGTYTQINDYLCP